MSIGKSKKIENLPPKIESLPRFIEKYIFESPKPAAVQKESVHENRNTEFENEIKKALFLALLEKGLITRAQYELCLGKQQ